MSIYQGADERTEELMILFKIITRHSWDRLQSYRQAFPGSKIEHLYRGLYVLIIPAGGAGLGA